jgi:hypothetical protein
MSVVSNMKLNINPETKLEHCWVDCVNFYRCNDKSGEDMNRYMECRKMLEICCKNCFEITKQTINPKKIF